MSTIRVGAVFSVISFLIASGRSAEAGFRRYSPNQCQIGNLNVMEYGVLDVNITNQNTGGIGGSSDRRVVFCPLETNTSFPIQSTGAGAIDVWNSGYVYGDGTSLLVTVCRRSNLTSGLTCSTTINDTTPGFHPVWFNTSMINLLQDSGKTDWYTSVRVGLPRENNTYLTSLVGYAIFN